MLNNLMNNIFPIFVPGRILKYLRPDDSSNKIKVSLIDILLITFIIYEIFQFYAKLIEISSLI